MQRLNHLEDSKAPMPQARAAARPYCRRPTRTEGCLQEKEVWLGLPIAFAKAHHALLLTALGMGTREALNTSTYGHSWPQTQVFGRPVLQRQGPQVQLALSREPPRHCRK